MGGLCAVAVCLRKSARKRVGQIRPIPAASVACAELAGNEHIACNLRHEEGQFSATISQTRFSPLATAARIYRSCGRGTVVGMFLHCGQQEESTLPDLISYATGQSTVSAYHLSSSDFRPGGGLRPQGGAWPSPTGIARIEHTGAKEGGIGLFIGTIAAFPSVELVRRTRESLCFTLIRQGTRSCWRGFGDRELAKWAVRPFYDVAFFASTLDLHPDFLFRSLA